MNFDKRAEVIEKILKFALIYNKILRIKDLALSVYVEFNKRASSLKLTVIKNN
jgi:hypothetical protein